VNDAKERTGGVETLRWTPTYPSGRCLLSRLVGPGPAGRAAAGGVRQQQIAISSPEQQLRLDTKLSADTAQRA
jgi:hypothetical protein